MKIHELRVFKYNPQTPSFGYSSPLKTMFLKGELPVKYGFDGNSYIKGILKTLTNLLRGGK